MHDENKVILVCGLKRSGNHVIIDWLTNNLKKDHVNWVNYRNQHSNFEASAVFQADDKGDEYGRNCLPFLKENIYSFEDIYYQQFDCYAKIANVNALKVCITRSQDNLIASRVRGIPTFKDYERYFVTYRYDKWIENESELIYKFNLTKNNFDLEIKYDEFITSKEYRQKIGEIFKIKSIDDSTLKSVNKNGGGSSFSGYEVDDIDNYLNRKKSLNERETKMFESISKAIKNYPYIFLIAHRGNVNGKNEKMENDPEYIMKASRDGYRVEADVWYVKGVWWVGHDKPEYPVAWESIEKSAYETSRLILHAKNYTALAELTRRNVHCFWHQEDKYTLTSAGYVWIYPGVKDAAYTKNSIINLRKDDDVTASELLGSGGICSDFPAKIRSWIISPYFHQISFQSYVRHHETK